MHKQLSVSFYALALLSEPGDDVHGTYACGAYVSLLLQYGYAQNYYYGIRRYPYTTDLRSRARVRLREARARLPRLGGGARRADQARSGDHPLLRNSLTISDKSFAFSPLAKKNFSVVI